MQFHVTPYGIALAILGLGETNPGDFDGNVPGGDQLLDDLFPPDDEFSFATTQNTPAEPASPTPPQATPNDPDFFLKAGDSVYKSAQEAAEGIRHKDTVIQDMRQKLIAITGYDPLTQKPIGAPAPAAPQESNYAESYESYLRDLQTAVDRNDPAGYARVQQKFVMDTLSPYAGVLVDLSRSQAVEAACKDIPEFRQFKDSQDYREVLESAPKLKQAIELAEQDMRFKADLPDLYKMAYGIGQYRKMPELLRAAAQQPATPNSPPARPTTSPSHVPPPAPLRTEGQNPNDLLRTPEGRKALIEDAQRRGLDKISWG
jgi:hypothetical protein